MKSNLVDTTFFNFPFKSIIQNNPDSAVDKKKTETIATGNCKLYPSELSSERFEYYQTLRVKVYEYYNHLLLENPLL